MTCIVGVVNNKHVYIGGDSAAFSESDLTCNVIEGSKVFKKGEFIFGFSTSFRMGQILQFKFNPPKKPLKMNDYEYMATLFLDKLRSCFDDNGYLKFEEDGADFLVGFRGNLYEVCSDYQVGMAKEGYSSLGCGANIANGALYATKDKPTEERIMMALEAASHHSVGVRPPFKIVKI